MTVFFIDTYTTQIKDQGKKYKILTWASFKESRQQVIFVLL